MCIEHQQETAIRLSTFDVTFGLWRHLVKQLFPVHFQNPEKLKVAYKRLDGIFQWNASRKPTYAYQMVTS